MKLRIEHDGTVLEYEGEGAHEMANTVLRTLFEPKVRMLTPEEMKPARFPVKVLDWGPKRIHAIKVLREHLHLPLQDAKQITEVVPTELPVGPDEMLRELLALGVVVL